MRALLLAALTIPAIAAATPRAQSAEECVGYADLALVASTLAKHGVEQDRARAMMPDMYNLMTADAQAIADDIVRAAYGRRRGEPKDFAASLAKACMTTGGQMGLGDPA